MNCKGLCLLLAASAAAGRGTSPVTHYDAVNTPPPALAGQSANLAMTGDGHERMTVPVMLGDRRSYDFLVDTGADRTSVSLELARELGLSERPPALLHSATGASEVRMAWLPELRLNRHAVRNISAPMLSAVDIGADGILGIDSLRSQRVIFDFARATLSILPGDAPESVADDAIVVRAKRREGRLVITDAEIEGERVSVVLDTGSSLTVGNPALRRKLARSAALSRLGPVDLVSVTGGSLRGELASVSSLEIGGARLEGLQMVFVDAHTFGELHLDRRPAILLGMNALRGFDQVTIDFARRSLSLVLPRKGKPGRA